MMSFKLTGTKVMFIRNCHKTAYSGMQVIWPCSVYGFIEYLIA